MSLQVIEPRIRGFISLTAHPEGCAVNVREQREVVRAAGITGHIGTALVIDVPWIEVVRRSLVPSLTLRSDYLLAVVAILGTTIGPYLIFWQAAEEVEDLGETGKKKPKSDRPKGERSKDRPKGDRPKGDRPKGDRPKSDRPKGEGGRKRQRIRGGQPAAD